MKMNLITQFKWNGNFLIIDQYMNQANNSQIRFLQHWNLLQHVERSVRYCWSFQVFKRMSKYFILKHVFASDSSILWWETLPCYTWFLHKGCFLKFSFITLKLYFGYNIKFFTLSTFGMENFFVGKQQSYQ